MEIEALLTAYYGMVESRLRSPRSQREDAGATVPDQQMRVASHCYPVDRYLVDSSNKFELVNILGDDIWHQEPALRPEDEIILRKLHEMLQSTADDLKTLSGELTKFHEPGVQVKSQPTPLDEDFNEKVHIEELVNAKFHGYKIIDQTPKPVVSKEKECIKYILNNLRKNNTADIQLNSTQTQKPVTSKKLSITRPRLLEIHENKSEEGSRIINKNKTIKTEPTVVYNEFSYKYEDHDAKINQENTKNLLIQEMPRIDIRSELREQKVLQLDIVPDSKDSLENQMSKPNVAVIAVEHEPSTGIQQIQNYKQYPQSPFINKQPIRKVYKMSTCDSSGSTNNFSSDTQEKLKHATTKIKISTKSSAKSDKYKSRGHNVTSKNEARKRTHLNLEEWKKKLNVVYGKPSSSKSGKTTSNNKSYSKMDVNVPYSKSTESNHLNNAEYIPYSQLTLGGARVSDIEKQISDIPNKHDIPLSPILDKILTSRENSFHHESPKKERNNNSPRILSTSDENLLQEVLDIEKTVSHTILKNMKKKIHDNCSRVEKESNNEENDHDSYADDFEEEKSEHSGNDFSEQKSDDSSDDKCHGNDQNQNKTYTKVPNLSFKDTVDIFEFIHSVDTQDSGTQSNTVHKISLKETQTSPTSDSANVQPIYNELWPTLDHKGEVEKMFKIEKDFIKKLIIDEYGDLLQSNVAKPSTSREDKEDPKDKNLYSFQKNTQTSPARVKSIMTSPKKTKTRTTSPFLSLTVDHQTSPMIVVTSEKEVNVTIDEDDECISINMSSPRFNLRLPQTSREVLSNLDVGSETIHHDHNEHSASSKKCNLSHKRILKPRESSTSLDADKSSSSEISSLGEVKLRLMRKIKKIRVPTVSESSSSSSSTLSKYSSELDTGILPLKSEGEISVGQTRKIKTNNKSEGETSYGQL